MTQINRLLLPVVFIFLLSACAPAAPPEGRLPFSTLEQKNDSAYIGQQQYNALDPGLMVFQDEDAASEGGVWFSESARRALRDIPWQTRFAVAVFQGWKPTGGYGVTVKTVTRAANVLRIDAEFAAPGPAPPPAVTSPYQLIALGRPPVPPEDLVVELWVAGERLAVYPEE